MKLILSALLFYLLLTCVAQAQVPGVELHEFAAGFIRPTDVVSAGDDRLYVAEMGGTIRIVEGTGTVRAVPFLDISSRVANPQWTGIFGVAFHPAFQSNGFFFVKYIRSDASLVVSRFQRDAILNDYADPATERVIFTLPNATGHLGGTLAFGPDGYLYIPIGDGEPGGRGQQGDPNQVSQNPQSYLGKILRLDIDGGVPYAIPPGNPYQIPGDGYPDELWALGVRNPWKLTFDRLTGDLWLGDNGQDGWEEVDYWPYPFTEVPNFGWSCFEGTHAYNPCPGSASFTPPVYEYPGYTNNANQSASVMGGYVYRGHKYPALQGRYFFADYSQGLIGSFERQGAGTSPVVAHGTVANPIGFGQDAVGELYLATFFEGKLYQIRSTWIETVQSGNWENPATWSCDCVPAAANEVLINQGHTLQLDGPARSVKSLRLLGSLHLGGELSVSGDN